MRKSSPCPVTMSGVLHLVSGRAKKHRGGAGGGQALHPSASSRPLPPSSFPFPPGSLELESQSWKDPPHWWVLLTGEDAQPPPLSEEATAQQGWQRTPMPLTPPSLIN